MQVDKPQPDGNVHTTQKAGTTVSEKETIDFRDVEDEHSTSTDLPAGMTEEDMKAKENAPG